MPATGPGTGGGGGLPLVLLHGFGLGGFAFDPLMPFLAHDGPVLVPDLPGHGAALDQPAGGAGRMARAIVASLDAAGFDRFHLAGHSLGGATAALIALKSPARVASLTLIAPGGMGVAINAPALAAHASAAGPDEIAAALAVMYGPGSAPDPALVATMESGRAVPGALAALEMIRAAMIGAGGEQGCLDRAALQALPMPVSIVWGDQDAIVPAEQADGLDPPLRVTILSGKGHMLVAEAPATIAQIIAETVARSG